MKIDIHTKDQSGGINIGQLNVSENTKYHEPQNDTWVSKVKDGFWKHVGQIGALALFGGAATLLTYNHNKMPDAFNVHSENQSGGFIAGQVNIYTDKESMGIRKPFGLYRDGKHVGDVEEQGIKIDENQKTFSFEKIIFDKPLPNNIRDYVFAPFEFGKYVIRITHADSVKTMMPSEASHAQGILLEIKD